MSMINAKETNANINSSGDYIASKMRLKNLKNKDVADELGVSEATVSYWIHNKTNPEGENLKKLADLLGVTPYEIQQGHDETPEEKTKIYEELNRLQKENDSLLNEVHHLKDDNAKALHKINEVEGKGADANDTVNIVLGLIMIVMALTFLPQMTAEEHMLAVLGLIISFFLGIIVFIYGFVMFLKHNLTSKRK